MKSNLSNLIKYQLRRVKHFLFLLPNFNVKDSFNLSFYKEEVAEDHFIYFKPKKWSHAVKVRKSYRDLRTLKDVFLSNYHLPPNSSKLYNDSVIVDLGCNIGITVAHFKNIFPKATVIGYEMDCDNYLLAKANTKGYKNVYLYNQAIWIDNSFVEYEKHDGFDGYSIHIKSEKNENIKVKGITLKELIKKHQLEKIDYLKMDIEGAEKDILNDNDLDWLDSVNSINIELHLVDDIAIQNYIDILKSKGFEAWKDSNHVSSIIAVKKS